MKKNKTNVHNKSDSVAAASAKCSFYCYSNFAVLYFIA